MMHTIYLYVPLFRVIPRPPRGQLHGQRSTSLAIRERVPVSVRSVTHDPNNGFTPSYRNTNANKHTTRQ